jgi:hypothetical protein
LIINKLIEKIKERFLNPLNYLISIITVLSSIFFAGYKIGSFERDIECKTEQLKASEEFNDKYYKLREDCFNYRIEMFKKSESELRLFEKQLNERLDGKK